MRYSILFTSFYFTSAFALTPIINVALFFPITVFLFYFITQSQFRNHLISTGIPTALMCLYVLFLYSGTLIINMHNGENIFHLIAIIFILIWFHLLQAYLRFQNYDKIFGGAFIAMLIASLVVILDSLLINLYHIDLHKYLNHPVLTELHVTALGFYTRARGFAEEPGHFAYFLSTMGFLGLFKVRQFPKLLRYSIYLVYSASILLTFSVALIIFLPACIIFWLLILNYRTLNSAMKTSMIMFPIIMALYITGIIDLAVTIVDAKMNLDNVSLNDRVTKLTTTINHINKSNLFEIMFGGGPGSYIPSKIPAPLSFYFVLVLDYGLIGLFLFIIFNIYLFLRISFTDQQIRFYVYVALSVALCDFFVIANYWYPAYWVVVAMILIPNRKMYVD